MSSRQSPRSLAHIALILLLAGCSESVWRDYTSPSESACSQYLARCNTGAAYCNDDNMKNLCGSISRVSEDIYDYTFPVPVDVLFVIDNSQSMSPKQKVFAGAIPTLMQKLNSTFQDYHLGVVTTDVGTFSGSAIQACNSANGDDGTLQNTPCPTRIPAADQNTEFALACKSSTTGLCQDITFVPRDRWIAKNKVGINVSPSNPGALTPDEIVSRAFQCIALVGDYGCGAEAPLEAMKRALDGHRPENQGFLRDDSVLGVIFLTDEDDCSVKLGGRQYLDPAATNCGTSNPDPDYKCFSLDYRCIAKSLTCAEPLNTPGKKTSCQERASSFLEPTQNYARFLNGLRPADRLVIAGIWTPSIQDYQARGYAGDGKLEIDGSGGDFSTNLLNRGDKTKAACYDPDPMMKLTTSPKGFFGQAQMRLSSFIRQFNPSNYIEQSICDASNYGKVFDTFANVAYEKSKSKCLSKPLLDGGNPACVAGFVDAADPHAFPDHILPQCTPSCCNAWAAQSDASVTNNNIISACMTQPADCYCAIKNTAGRCPDTAVAGVWRQGNAPYPVGKVVNFRCATQP